MSVFWQTYRVLTKHSSVEYQTESVSGDESNHPFMSTWASKAFCAGVGSLCREPVMEREKQQTDSSAADQLVSNCDPFA